MEINPEEEQRNEMVLANIEELFRLELDCKDAPLLSF